MSTQDIGIAMSGGVDSTVTAILLREQGYRVHGFFMQLPLPGLEYQVQRVKDIADAINIPLQLVDMRDIFSRTIISSFLDTYREGKTPNPCIRCNKLIKFGTLVERMRQAGMDKTATGHYVQLQEKHDTWLIKRGIDPTKDQSYFLCRLLPNQLQHLLFPLGEWTKEEAYAKAQTLGMDFSGQESQDVCFLPNGLQDFLREQGVQDQEGSILTAEGKTLGSHLGIWHYTVGQRRGLGLPDATPWYVVGLDGNNNQVIVGKNESLMRSSLTIEDLQWQIQPPALPWEGLVQIRSRHKPAPAQVSQLTGTLWQITFEQPQRAITPGQFAVFYDQDTVIGSGVINDQSAISQP